MCIVLSLSTVCLYRVFCVQFDNWTTDTQVILFPTAVATHILPVVVALLLLLGGARIGAPIAFMVAFYYLSYEWLHLAYHAPPQSVLGRLPGMAYLRHHHLVHHAQTGSNPWLWMDGYRWRCGG